MRWVRMASYFKSFSWQHVLADGLVMAASLFLSLYLRVGWEGYAKHFAMLLFYLPFILVIRWLCLTGAGVYTIMWRYVSAMDAWRLMQGILVSTAIVVALTFFAPESLQRLPRSVYIIDLFLVSMCLMGARMLRRLEYESRGKRAADGGVRTLIFGAGNNGRLLAQRFRSDSALNTNLIGFIDDDVRKANVVISGVPVLGTRTDLEALIQRLNITQVVISTPFITGDVLREIVQITRPFNIRPRILHSMRHSDSVKVFDVLRDVDLRDLLNRPRREIDLGPILQLLQGKRVLVTGAGGSIGSELARQIMAHNPGLLLLLDHSEYNLYEIDKELRLSTHDMQKVVPLLIDLKDEKSLNAAMRQHAPEIVFHAAAYKHVHLVEANPHSSILNNVKSLELLLKACKAIDVQSFVLISTDKAVNPAGVMGATKRVCEILVTAAALETGRRYCSVRFGNVLGSSGSLIPHLTKQIQEGGPVTVTHPDMARFFMLIPEAVSLVLKAATIARPGDLNVLKMGEPVKIVDIVRSLIALMGQTEQQIPIVFTGLRPGEKMFEELYIRGDELTTEHPDILTLPDGDSGLRQQPAELAKVLDRIEALIHMAEQHEPQAIRELYEIVDSKYSKPGNEIKDTGRIFSRGTRGDH